MLRWPRVTCCLVALMLAGCTADDAGGGPSRFDGGGATSFAVAGDGTLYAAGPARVVAVPDVRGQVRTSTPSPTGSPAANTRVLGVNRDTAGRVWTVLAGNSSLSAQQVANRATHLANPALAALTADGDPRPPLTEPRVSRSVSAVAVQDDQTVLVATEQQGLAADGAAADVLLWRVTADGAVPIAGRLSPVRRERAGGSVRWRATLARPAQDLDAGVPVPANTVDMQRVQAVQPLSSTRAVLVTRGMPASRDADAAEQDRARDEQFVFLLDGGSLTRISAPDVRQSGLDPVLSPLSEDRALLTTGWVGENPPYVNLAWVVVDPATKAARRVGSGPGAAVGDGSGTYLELRRGQQDAEVLDIRQVRLP
ncbi:MAG: hypothetical protein ACRC35_04245 [Angustibacter sp.]